MNAPVSVGQLDRQKYLGGSDVAAILGISPWRTPLDVFLDKVRGREEITDPAKLKVLRRGTRMEPYILDLLAEEEGIEIVARGERYLDPTHDFIAAEIDAETDDGRNIEIKSSSPFKSREWGEQQTDRIPVYYAAQAMHGLMVTGREQAIFGVLIGSDDFRVYRLDRDEETIAAIREKEVEFWQRVQANDPPAASTVDDVLRFYGPKDDGAALTAPAHIAEAVAQLKQLKADVKDREGEIERIEEEIKVFLGPAATLLGANGKPLATWKAQTSVRLDGKALEAAHPDLAAKFKKATETRVLRIK
ncbi:YqaJ viral recombinase family protein [Derxia gummosa]|uniref:YqaJ viral recombinase family protein n=1 Tax=Derxia gummosa DSM 723 TaxID=1121388 RepID=A0A8B6X2R2_9BURK|nr:YqaJ viral recombinase family protein [Derxia gummosa]